MKTKILIICAVMGLSQAAFSQFTFSIAPGLSFNGASFGYKLDKFVPFVGLQYYGGTMDYGYSYEEFDYDSGTFEKRFNTSEGHLNLFLPNIGVKYFFYETENLKAHALINFTKPIISGESEYDGEPDEYLEDMIDGLSIWGGELSFGVEYFFDEHFSVGGEFGLRYLHIGSDYERDRILYNPIDGTEYMSEVKSSTKFNLKPTFSRISLNFYF